MIISISIVVAIIYIAGFLVTARLALRYVNDGQPINYDDFGDWLGVYSASFLVAAIWPVTVVVFGLPYLYWRIRYDLK